MLTFLFWNLKLPRADILASIVDAHRVDVLMLAECPLKPASVLESLNLRENEFYYVPTDCPKVAVYTRFSDQYLLPHQDGADFSIRRLTLLNRPELLLCIVHFPSKQWSDPIDQTTYSINFSNVLSGAEEKAGHTRTVLVGDLNMNPYEDGLVLTSGLHAVVTREIALRTPRKVKFDSNLYFYNPMWGQLGERAQGHGGTYYYASPKARADFWNVFDQVLLRPDILPYFQPEDVMILHRDEVANVSFLTAAGFPDAKPVSDHLPILFRLRI
jgi:hypothetical protein